MKNAIVYALLCCLCLCCSKTDAPNLTFGDLYVKHGVAARGVFRLFAKPGEIKNADILAVHEALDTTVFSNLSTYLGTNPSFYIDTLRFDAPGSATVRLTIRPATYRLQSTGSSYTLTSVDTLTGFIAGQPFSQSIYNHLPKVQMTSYSEGIYSGSPGSYTYYHEFTDRFIITGARGDAALTVPFILYANRLANGDALTFWVHGQLDPGFYTSLNAGDTLALREYDLLYQH